MPKTLPRKRSSVLIARLGPTARATRAPGCCKLCATPASPGCARTAWARSSRSSTKPRCRRKAKIPKHWRLPTAIASSFRARSRRCRQRFARSSSFASLKAALIKRSRKSLRAPSARSCPAWLARGCSSATRFPSRSRRRRAVPCEHSQLELHGYLDGELDAMGAANCEKHLEDCPDCKRVLAAEESLRSALQNAALYERAPESLRKNLLGTPEKKVTPIQPGRVSGFAWQWLAAAAVLFLAVEVGWGVWQRSQSPSSMQLVAASLVDAHLRSLQPGHLTDVESTDQHTVKPWFDGKLDFIPPVEDFSQQGFPLMGGRLDVLGGRTVAALVYGRRKHVVSVFVAKLQGSEAWSGEGEMQGYHWLAWQQNGLQYCAVSDVAPADLKQLQQLLSRN